MCYTLSVRPVPRYQLRPLSVLARIWSPELTRAVRHAGVKSSIDSLMMFNEPTPRYPVVLLAPGLLSLHLPDRFICLPLSPFIWPRLSPNLSRLSGWTDSFVSQLGCLARLSGRTSSFVSLCLPLSPFVSFLLSPSLDAWHGSLVIRGVFHGHACVFEAQKRVFERARALDQATGSMLRTHVRVLQVNDYVFLVCSS